MKGLWHLKQLHWRASRFREWNLSQIFWIMCFEFMTVILRNQWGRQQAHRATIMWWKATQITMSKRLQTVGVVYSEVCGARAVNKNSIFHAGWYQIVHLTGTFQNLDQAMAFNFSLSQCLDGGGNINHNLKSIFNHGKHVNSLWPSDTICIGTYRLPEPKMTYHQNCSVAFTWDQFHKKFSWTKSIKCIRRSHF